jgi:cobalamin transport system permease protein
MSIKKSISIKWVLGIQAALIIALVLGSLCVGPGDLSPTDIVASAKAMLTGQPPTLSEGMHDILWNLRLPRIILALMVGASLAAAGTLMQGLFQNPLAGPFTVGVSSGAALGAVVAISYSIDLGWGELSAATPFAFLFGGGTILLVYLLAWRPGGVSVTTLLLIGFALSGLLSSISSFIMIINNEDLQSVIFWLMGGFSARTWTHVYTIAPWLVVGSILIVCYSHSLNAILLGDETAGLIGIEVERTKRSLLLIAAMLASAAVAVAGVIGFVGIIVPHIMRLVVGPDHRRLLPASLFGGALLMLASDTLVRLLFSPRQIPVGIVTSLLGVPFFLFLIYRGRKEAEL